MPTGDRDHAWRADNAYDAEDFENELRSVKVTLQLRITPAAAALRSMGRRPSTAAMPSASASANASGGTAGLRIAAQEKSRFRGHDRVGWTFTFAAAAYNLGRLPKLIARPADGQGLRLRQGLLPPAGASSTWISAFLRQRRRVLQQPARAVSGQFESVFAYGGSLTPANQIRSLLSVAGRTIMAKGYSTDLRARAVALVEAGESRREVARLLDLAASTTIRWMDRWQTTGNVAAKPGTGYCHSPLEQHEQWLLDLVAAEPDLTLDEIGTRLASAKKLTVGRTSVWRFYDRHRITFKKNAARRRTGSA
jgi:transposase